MENNKCEIGMNKNNFSDYNMKSSDKEYGYIWVIFLLQYGIKFIVCHF